MIRLPQESSYAMVLTNWIQSCMHGPIDMYHSAKTKDKTKVHQTLSLLKERVWGRQINDISCYITLPR